MSPSEKVAYLMSNHLLGGYRYGGSFMLIVIYAPNMRKSSQYQAFPLICKIGHTDTHIVSIAAYQLFDHLCREAYDIAGIMCTGKGLLRRIGDDKSLIAN